MFYKARAFFRRHSRVAFAILVAIFAVPLVTLFTTTEFGGERAIYKLDIHYRGRRFTQREVADARETISLRIDLQTGFGLARRYEPSKEEIAVRLALLDEAERLRIRPTQEQLIQFLNNYPPILRLRDLVEQQMRQRGPPQPEAVVLQELQNLIRNRLQARRFREDALDRFVREEVMLSRLQELIGATAKVTPLELRQAYDLYHETVSLDIVEIPASQFAKNVTVTEDDIKKFYEADPARFTIPQRVRVLYVKFPAGDFKGVAKITDDEVRKAYEQQPDKFRDEKGALKPLDAALKEKIREELAEEAAIRAAFEQATALVEKLGNARQTVTVGDADIHSYYSQHAAEFTDSKGQPVPLEKIRSEAAYAGLLASLKHRVFVTKAMESCAGPQRTVGATDYFALQDTLDNPKVSSEFNREAFTLNEEEPFSRPTRSGTDVYVLALLAVKEPEVPPLDGVRDKIREVLVARKSREAAVNDAEAKLREIRQRLDKGETFAAICAEMKLKVTSPRPFSQMSLATERIEDIPQASFILPRIPDLRAGELSPPISTPDGAVFCYVRERKAADPKSFEKDKANFLAQWQQQSALAIFNEWFRAKVYPSLSVEERIRR